MKYSNTTIRELTARYSRVLKKCALLNAVILLGVAFAAPAMAEVAIEDGQRFEKGVNNDSANQNAAGLTITYGDSLSKDGVNNIAFVGNTSVNSGAAMKALNGFVAGDGWTFEGNTSNKISGGLYVKIPDDADSNRNVVLGNNTTFKNNSSKWLGGALGIESADTVTIGDATFESNHSDADGGAIAIWTDKSNGATSGTELTLGKTQFVENTANNRGGAIANLNNDKPEDKTDFYNTVHVGAGSYFEKNTAKAGGAIYNLGDMTFGDGVQFVENGTTNIGGAIYNAGTIGDMNNVLFKGNKVEATKDAPAGDGKDTYAQGGAIYNTGSIGTITGDFIQNEAHTTATNAGKATANGGALALYRSTIEGIVGNFDGNKAIAEIAEGGSTDYAKGSSAIVSAGGGAIHIEGKYGSGEATKIGSIVGNFTNNSAMGDGYANGGAIYIKAGKDTDVSIDQITGNFINNTVVAKTADTDVEKASTGGAISIKEDGKKATVSVAGNFEGNSVTTNATNALGGAVYNEGTFTVAGNFTGNSVSSTSGQAEGGAIYNSGDGTIHFEGTNTFTNNTANDVKNDIHNEGTLNVAGNLTLDGGITGTGDVVFDAGSSLTATLNTTTILANSVTTNGSNLNLLVANGTADGAYDFVTADSLDQAFKLGDNTLYDLTMGDDGKISVVKKSTDEVAGALTSAGAGTNEAAAIVAITNVETTGNAQADAVLNQITTAAQTGDVETAAGIVKQINPTEAPVVQAVATNGAVLSAVTNRLAIVGTTTSAGAQGRSGGDVVVSKLSPWVQGLYNKTHNSQGIGFDAYSQGFAFGVDTDLNDDWTVGVGYAYTATDIKNSLRKTQVYGDNYFVYGQYKPSNWYVNGVINYGHSNYKDIGALTNHYDVDTYGAQVMTGYQWDILNNYAGVRYTYIDTDKYNNGLTEVDTKSSQIATAVIGTKVSKDFTPKQGVTLTPEFRLAATYDFKSDGSSATVGIVGSSASYTVEGERLHRAAVETGIGLTAKIKNLELSANYDASLRSENNTQAVNLKAIYHF